MSAAATGQAGHSTSTGHPARPRRGPIWLATSHQALWGHLALRLAWAAAFTTSGLIIFQLRTRTRRHTA